MQRSTLFCFFFFFHNSIANISGEKMKVGFTLKDVSHELKLWYGLVLKFFCGERRVASDTEVSRWVCLKD